ncbi:MAG: imidazolonepropionase [Hyphomicrobiaceae bacterium]
MQADRLIVNGRIWTGEPGADARPPAEGLAIAERSGRIVFLGPAGDAPTARETLDAEGRLVTPGLVDCHTHIVHAGNRAGEWQMRLEGRSYEEVARAGGGIVSTVRSVRAASEDRLVAETLPRLDRLIAEGVTTIEVKSGYGLDAENEAKMLRAARRLERTRNVTVRATHLGAHAMPPGATDKDAYIADVIERQLPLAVGESLVDAVDAFCEGIAFSPDQVRRVFAAARAAGIPVKIHAEQLSNLGGAAMAAAEFAALSADHVEFLDEAGIAAMAKAGTVAVLLPGAFYFIKETRKPPVAGLRAAGVPMAGATDCNPGSSPLTSLLLAMNMACTFFGLTPLEALAGTTREAARALGILDHSGTVAPTKWCDLAIWNVGEPAEIVYGIGHNPLWKRVWRGHV